MSLYENLMERLNGHPYSNYFTACCPYHHEQHPSFFVYEDGRFYCSSCGKKGKHEQLDRFLGSRFRPTSTNSTVSNILPAWKSWERQYGDLQGIVDFAHQNLLRYPRYQSYYQKRKVDEYITKGHLGWLDGWATIPVYSRTGSLVDLVVRSTRSGSNIVRYVVHPINVHNASRPLYCPNWQRVETAETVYVVYGIFDAISLELCGLPVVTGITGKSLQAELLSPLQKRFIILPDYHEEGSAHKLANSLGWRAKVRQLLFPDDTKDVDDVRRGFGNEYLLNLIGA